MLTDIRRTSTPDTLEAIDPNVYPNFSRTYTHAGTNILNCIAGDPMKVYRKPDVFGITVT